MVFLVAKDLEHMRQFRRFLFFVALTALPYTLPLIAQPMDLEANPLVLEKLHWFQDLKFGLMMHWGPYSQWGIVESWSLCPEDEPWCRRKGAHAENYDEYRRAYEGLQATFNPFQFNPAEWAALARTAGMRYLVFTTKHHDGFCMFDTKETEYRITSQACPFSADPRANVTKEIFNAFRAEGLGIGAYFSKPDWHSPDYWWPYFPPLDRNVNYAISKYPDRWHAFQEYTFRQIKEVVSEYGSVDILWLDGGWVNPGNRGQDIDMPAIAAMARSYQPGLIIVDRSVPGRFENYRTPEQEVPDAPPDYVWETCMTMGTSWSYVPNDRYKTARQLVHLLVDIVAKGGNFLLNVGPGPDGTLPPVAVERLNDIGEWMRVNGDAIYGTRPVPPYREGSLRFTRLPDGTVNAVYCGGEDETGPPALITLSSLRPVKGSAVTMLGAPGALQWEEKGGKTIVVVPDSLRLNPPCRHAWTLRFRAE